MTSDQAGLEALSPVKKALLTIERLQSRLETLEQSRRQPIAVIGLGCRFPGGADNPDAFWGQLCEGHDAITEVPADRLDLGGLYDPDPEKPGKMYMRMGGFLDQVDGFDTQFFQISPREAAQMDPQQRLFLEVSWEALENAGQRPSDLVGSRTGVFAGVLSSDYAHLAGALSERIDAYYYPGINGSFIAGRLSYFLGLHGPSVTVDTACSSSLVAVHMACQSLRSGESDLALAGGVNLILSPEISMFLCRVKAMSPTGRCRAFDKDADGMVRGEGCGVVVLKRLSDAVVAGDNVLAVIRGSAVNHDGASGGLTVPNPRAQEMLYRAAMRDAGVEPEDVSYVEAHGTGTHLGDPIELQGLSAAYCQGRSPDQTLWIGSVKTNIGHTDSAAGVANLIKTVLILKHGHIPPTLHYKEPNPQFSWKDFPIAVAQRLMPLAEKSAPHLAAASAFGLSGVNAHVILEQASTPHPAHAASGRAEPPEHLLPLSAKTPEALRQLASAYRDRLIRQDAVAVDLCAAAATRRSHLDHRLAVVGQSGDELAAGLQTFLQNESSPAVAVGQAGSDPSPRLAFVFSGQGAQWWAMGRELLQREPVFQERLEQIEAIFSRLAGWSLVKALSADEHDSRIHDTEVAQPAIFAVQVALAAVYERWGIVPQAVVGQSMGEVAAAHVAGALTLEDAVRVIYHRGRLLERATGLGKMLAVSLGFDAAQELVHAHGDRISIAAYNGPSSVVLSGEERAIDEVLAGLNARGVFCRELHVKFASHCPQMEAYQQDLVAVLAGIRARPAAVPIVSTVTGQWGTDTSFDAEYWGKNIRAPVLFATAIGRLIDDGYDAFLEFDPHPMLGASISQCLESRARRGLVLKTLHRERGERQALLESLAELHVHGHPVDLRLLYPDHGGEVTLPNYPWQRKRYWLKAGSGSSDDAPAKPSTNGVGHPLLGERIASPLREAQFRSQVRASSPEYLQGHRIAGRVVFPASCYQVMALAAATALDDKSVAVTNLSFLAPLVLSDQGTTLQVVVSPRDGEAQRTCRIYSTEATAGGGPWSLHAAGSVGRATDVPTEEALDIEAVEARCEQVSAEAFYQEVERRGYEYRGSFRSIDELWRGRGEVLSRIRLPVDGGSEQDRSMIHPALLDACMHSILAVVDFGSGAGLYVPREIERLRLFSPPGTDAWALATLRRPAEESGGLVTVDIRLFDAAGRLTGEIAGLTLSRAPSWAQPGAAEASSERWCYEVQWEPKPIEDYSLSARRPGSCVVFAAEDAVGVSLVRALKSQGHDPCVVRPGEAYAKSDARTWTLDPREPPHFRRLFRDLAEAQVVCSDVVFVGTTAESPGRDASRESLRAEQDVLCGGALHLVQAVEQAGLESVPRLWLVTQNCQATGREELPVDPRPATLWGLARVIGLEHPALACTCLDLDGPGSGSQSSLIVREIEFNDGEAQVAFRRGARHVARLGRVALPPSGARGHAELGSSAPRQVRISRSGILDNLVLRPMARRPPGPDEVEIQVSVTGLNFRDVLNALGMLDRYVKELGVDSPAEMPFGHECAGTIVAVGKDVSRFETGDEVIAALATGSLGSFVTVKAEFVVRRPARMSQEQAATVPVAFLTAYYGLHELAKIRRGDRVLIHCAAGGVGQAAVQLARHAGAKVFGTASVGKWEFVRSLGVERVLNSRTVEFADELLEATDGRGVDIVLNSLSGEFISRSFEVCAPGARFVEIGRIGILDESEARAKRPDVAYFPVVLPEVAQARPELIASMLRDILRLMDEGALEPLPLTVYPIENVVAAFRSLSQAKHVGKVVVSQPANDGTAPAPALVRRDGTYLITGGLGALGLRVARWLVDQGAQHLVLVGRRGASGTAAEELRRLESDGANVLVAEADVSNPNDIARTLAEIEANRPPLRGVVHAAAVLDDGVLVQQSLERFRRVLAPKVEGAWLLHLLTREMPLDFFVCFSSTVALLGSPGQGNYAAANAFMDALAHHRRASKLPALSVNWGPWGETGLAASLSPLEKARWTARGVETIPPEHGLELLGRLLQAKAVQVAVLPVDWSKFLRQLPAPSSLLEAFSPAREPLSPDPLDLLRSLERAPAAERRALLVAHVRSQVGRVLGLASPDSIKLRQRLFDLGLDSLMAVELRNRLERSVGRSLRSTLVFDHPTVEGLVDYLAEHVLSLGSLEGPEPEQATEDGQELSGVLDQLSREEIADLLASELSGTNEGDAP